MYVLVIEQPLFDVEDKPAKATAPGKYDPFCNFTRLEGGGHHVAAIADIGRRQPVDTRHVAEILVAGVRVHPQAFRSPLPIAIIEREDTILAGLRPPQLDHLA